ncbi:MAG: hypothetical protein IJM50_03960 [Lachnospiraceae bacterium]|nr:hypothetical protein [Lachnospiraceae bacterium]
MRQIAVMDTILCRKPELTFREKLEIARKLERLNVQVIELPEIADEKADTLLVRTMASFVKNAVLSVGAGSTKESVLLAAKALADIPNARIRIELPVSSINMEYISHQKPDRMPSWIASCVKEAKESVPSVEFAALDSTRADEAFLLTAIQAAEEAGADCISIYDNANTLMPDDFAALVSRIVSATELPVSVFSEDKNGTAAAAAALSVKKGASGVKCAIGAGIVDLETFGALLEHLGRDYGLATGLKVTEIHSIGEQIRKMEALHTVEKNFVVPMDEGEVIRLTFDDDKSAVSQAVVKLGYDLSEDDLNAVFEEVKRTAENGAIGAKELDAIISTSAMQVPATYELKQFIVNSGNAFSSTAQIILERGAEELQSVAIGNGPIDAAFQAISRIIGHAYELDDFQIHTVTEGQESIGSANVKLRANGKVYSGNGISRDIIGASIRAYVNALNKIIYEGA